MMGIIFILSTFGYLGLLYILNWELLITCGLIFLFLGFWIFVFWWDGRKRKLERGKEEGENKHPLVLRVDNKDGSYRIVDSGLIRKEVEEEINGEILERIVEKVRNKIRERL